MAIIVNSPFSGKPVKLRDQDVGRAVRDEEGRIFYVLERSDGQGYYSSPTRMGGAKDEQRYLEMQGKTLDVERQKREAPAVHDIQGKPRRNSVRGKLVILVLALVVVAVGWLAWKYKDRWQAGPAGGTIIVDQPAGGNSGQ